MNAAERPVVFDRKDTKAIKGIAVILMLFHHLAGFPSRLPVGFSGFVSLWQGFIDSGYLVSFAGAAKLCVPIFFFLGGYGLYSRWEKGNLSLTQSILSLYKTYWKVFVVFIPIAFLFFARSGENINPWTVRYVFPGVKDMVLAVISEFIGWSSNLNPEWWFFKSYVCALLLGYLFCLGIKKHQDFWVDLFLVLGVDILVRSVFPAICKTAAFSSLGGNLFYTQFLTIDTHATCFLAGIVFAKYDGICKLKKYILHLPLPGFCSALGFGMLYLCRTYILDCNADILYCALMIPMLSVILDRTGVLHKGFSFLGKHSANIWLIHSFYCYYFLEIIHLVYCTKNVWIDLGILVGLSLLSSIGLDRFYALAHKLIQKRAKPLQLKDTV